MKQQEKPKSILNVFFKGGTRARIGLKVDVHDAISKIYNATHKVDFDTTNEDETIESEIVTIYFDDLLFYSIQTPRIETDLVVASADSLSRIHQ
jgi:hypothetical protein